MWYFRPPVRYANVGLEFQAMSSAQFGPFSAGEDLDFTIFESLTFSHVERICLNRRDPFSSKEGL